MALINQIRVQFAPRKKWQVMSYQRKKRFSLLSQKGTEGAKVPSAEGRLPPRKSNHHWQRHGPTNPTVRSVMEVRTGMCHEIKMFCVEIMVSPKMIQESPCSRSWLQSFIFPFLFLRWSWFHGDQWGPSVQSTQHPPGLRGMSSSPLCDGSREWHLQF